MQREAAKELADALELELYSAGVCLPCLTLVAFPLDSGDERAATRRSGETVALAHGSTRSAGDSQS